MTTIDSIIESGNDGYLWNNSYRLRYVETAKIPYLCELPGFFGKDVILVDHAKPKDIFTKNIDAISLNEFDEVRFNTHDLQNDKENLQPDGCDLTGNPLKVTFLTKSMLEGAESDAIFQKNYGDLAKKRFPLECHPLNISEAFQLSNMISRQSIQGTSPFGFSLEETSMWIVVDGRDPEHHLLVGVKHNNKSHTTYSTKLFGCGHQIVNKLESLFSRISSLVGPQTNKYRTRRVAQCVYDVLTLQDCVTHNDPDFISAEFSVHAKWNVYNDEYLTRPPATTPVTINFAPGWLDQRLSLYDRSIEVSFLMRMTKWLQDQKADWPSKEIQHEVLEKTSSLIENESLAKSSPSEQHDYDFTEKLWDILKECKSGETLARAFKLIFDKLCNNFSAMVRSDNISSLAKWLRISRREDLALPRLEPLTCVQLLTEIGVDRLKRDITTDFLTNQLIQSVTDLQSFFKPNSLAVEDRASALLPIHLALQYMIQVELYVRLQPHEKIDITRRVIPRFCGTKLEDPRHEHFSFEATIGSVSERILSPDTLSDWSLDCGYDGNDPRVRALVHFAKQVDFEHFASKMKVCRSKRNSHPESGEDDEAKEGLELVDLFYCTVSVASILPTSGIFSYH